MVLHRAPIWGNPSKLAGVFDNMIRSAMIYAPDPSRQAVSDFTNRGAQPAPDWPGCPANKLSLSFDLQDNCDCHRGIEERRVRQRRRTRRRRRPRAAGYVPNNITPGDLELAGDQPTAVRGRGMAYIFSWRDLPEPGVTFDMNSILEQSINIRYRAAPIYTPIRKSSQVNGRASMSYVTGSHLFKTGLFWHHAWRQPLAATQRRRRRRAMTYTFNHRSPDVGDAVPPSRSRTRITPARTSASTRRISGRSTG